MIPLAGSSDESYRGDLDFLAKTDSTLSIVVPEGLLFAPIWYYAPGTLRSRLFYLLDMATAEKTTDTTNENIMVRLRPLMRDQVVDLDNFTRRHSTFLVYYQGGSANSSLDSLLQHNCKLSLSEKSAFRLLFRAECDTPK